MARGVLGELQRGRGCAVGCSRFAPTNAHGSTLGIKWAEGTKDRGGRPWAGPRRGGRAARWVGGGRLEPAEMVSVATVALAHHLGLSSALPAIALSVAVPPTLMLVRKCCWADLSTNARWIHGVLFFSFFTFCQFSLMITDAYYLTVTLGGDEGESGLLLGM